MLTGHQSILFWEVYAHAFCPFCLFLNFWLCWVLSAVHGLSVAAARGPLTGCGTRASRLGGSSCSAGHPPAVPGRLWWVWRGLSSCGTWAWGARAQELWPETGLPCGAWVFSDPGWTPRLLHWQADSTAEPPGSPRSGACKGGDSLVMFAVSSWSLV